MRRLAIFCWLVWFTHPDAEDLGSLWRGAGLLVSEPGSPRDVARY